jgi:hypothetical protein
MKEFNDYPQLQNDTDGRIWLAFRHRTLESRCATARGATGAPETDRETTYPGSLRRIEPV